MKDCGKVGDCVPGGKCCTLSIHRSTNETSGNRRTTITGIALLARSFLHALLPLGALYCGGCSTVLMTDTLPTAQEKGYAEFYCDNGVTGILLPITQLSNGEEVSVGNTGSWPANKRRRVACSPGANTFFVKPDSCVKRVDAVVRAGMVTPVRVTFKEISTRLIPRSTIAFTHFDVEVTVDHPVSLSEFDARMQSWPSFNGKYPFSKHKPWVQQTFFGDSVVLAPASSAKGCVEFLNVSEGLWAGRRLTMISYCDSNGVVGVRQPNSRGHMDATATNLFVCAAGKTVFQLQGSRIKGTEQTVEVMVNEGMVTPVSIRYSDSERDLQGKIIPGEPYPMSEVMRGDAVLRKTD